MLGCSFMKRRDVFTSDNIFFFIDPDQKNKALEKVWENYGRAIDLYVHNEKSIRIEIPFRGTVIPGYLRITDKPGQPLVILINGMDNIKEVEQHYWGNFLASVGLNAFAFDGPGQGEMWKNMKYIPDYEDVVRTIIDWFEKNDKYNINIQRIGALGVSLGGYLSSLAAVFDKRIVCAVANGGAASSRLFPPERKVNPIVHRGAPYMAGTKSYKESLDRFNIDINRAPRLECPFLVFHSGKDKFIPNSIEHANCFMEWAVGKKELQFYPDGEHVCANYLDEVIPYTIDWLKKHLEGSFFGLITKTRSLGN